MKKVVIWLLTAAMLISATACCHIPVKEETPKAEEEVVTVTTTTTAPMPAELVEDALNYEKDVIPAEGAKEMGFEAAKFKHKIRLPKLTLETANAKALNDKMYQSLADKYEILKNNQELAAIYDIDYIYQVKNDVVGIVITYTHSVQMGGGNGYYYAYYYDVKNDKELTFDQYVAALDLDLTALLSGAKGTQEYDQKIYYVEDESTVYIRDCIAGEDGVVLFLNHLESMDGWCKVVYEYGT